MFVTLHSEPNTRCIIDRHPVEVFGHSSRSVSFWRRMSHLPIEAKGRCGVPYGYGANKDSYL
jgi:hypothetical protein